MKNTIVHHEGAASLEAAVKKVKLSGSIIKTKTLALWLGEPLAAVGIMDNIGKRVVSDDIINQVFTSSIPKLVRLLWRMNDYVANANGYGFGWRSHLATARDNHVELPLGGMGM